MNPEVVSGDLMDIEPEARNIFMKAKKEDLGLCAPRNIVDYLSEGKTNMFEYNRFLYEETEMWQNFVQDMPTKPKNWDQYIEWISMDKEGKRIIDSWRSIWMTSECRGKGRGGKGGKMDMMKDLMNSDDDAVIMRMGGTKIMIRMGATTVAASVAATLGAMTLI